MRHIVIVTGGYLNTDFAKEYLKTLSYDKVFAVDKGLEYVDVMNIVPDYLIGDFDTVNPELLAQYEEKNCLGEIHTMIERHPAMKDATDTELALDIAVMMGATSVTLLAATGSRMDHVLANLGLLMKAADNNVKMCIVDETNRIRLMRHDINKSCVILKKEQFGKYVSLVPLSAYVNGVTLKGALYPLENAVIYQGGSRTISNEIEYESMEITLEDGAMLVIESKD